MLNVAGRRPIAWMREQIEMPGSNALARKYASAASSAANAESGSTSATSAWSRASWNLRKPPATAHIGRRSSALSVSAGALGAVVLDRGTAV